MNDDTANRIIQNQITIINLIGAIAEKLIGQKPSVNIHLEDGSVINVAPTTSSVTWCQEGSQAPCLSKKETPR